MSTTMVPCPLGPNCLVGAQTHDAQQQQYQDCLARAQGKTTSSTMAAAFDPNRAYISETDAMRKIHTQIKRAWGADGRGIPNLVGPPGIGKSESVENMAKMMGADFMIFDVSSLDPDILNGIPYNPADDPEQVTEGSTDSRGRIRIAGRLYEREIAEMFYRDPKKPLIVFFDEINGGKEALMSSLQKVMTSRTLPQEGVRLQDNVFMVAAMNDADQTSNGNDLAAAMVSRLTPIEFRPNFKEWVNGELNFWGKGFDEERMRTVAEAMGEKAPTPEQYLEAVTHVANFLDKMGNANVETSSRKDDQTLNIFSEPLDEDNLTEKIGQPRSWSKAISGIASAIANPTPGETDTAEFSLIIKANCGERASRDFNAYHETHKDLPDIDAALEKGTLGEGRKDWKAQGRSDIPMFTVSVIANRAFDDVDKMGKALDLMAEIAEEYPDMAAASVPPMIARWTKSLRAAHGEDSPVPKALTTLTLEKFKTSPQLREAFGRRMATNYASDGTLSAQEAAVTAAKTAAKSK